MTTTAFDNAITASLKARRGLAGFAVTYTRGGNSASLVVVKGRSAMSLGDALLAGVSSEVTDFLFAAADLDVGSGVVTPEHGDTIEFVRSGETFTYRVTPVESEPAWRYVDAGQTEIRIHTLLEKRV